MTTRFRLTHAVLIALALLPWALAADSLDARSRHKGHAKPKTISRIFTNSDGIEINSYGSASPFPSTMQISGFKQGTMTDVDLVLKGFGHGRTRDVDILLVAPDGRNALVMSDAGGETAVAGLTIRLDDEASVDLFNGTFSTLTSGAYRPRNVNDNAGLDVFDPTFAPIPSGNVTLSTFDGGDPNGEWRLFIRDDLAGTSGIVAFGWELRVTAHVKGKKR